MKILAKKRKTKAKQRKKILAKTLLFHHFKPSFLELSTRPTSTPQPQTTLPLPRQRFAQSSQTNTHKTPLSLFVILPPVSALRVTHTPQISVPLPPSLQHVRRIVVVHQSDSSEARGASPPHERRGGGARRVVRLFNDRQQKHPFSFSVSAESDEKERFGVVFERKSATFSVDA